jgi:hypothetical protein
MEVRKYVHPYSDDKDDDRENLELQLIGTMEEFDTLLIDVLNEGYTVTEVKKYSTGRAVMYIAAVKDYLGDIDETDEVQAALRLRSWLKEHGVEHTGAEVSYWQLTISVQMETEESFAKYMQKMQERAKKSHKRKKEGDNG